MIEITKAEAAAVRERYPNIHVAKTVNKRFVEEDPRVMAFVRKLRNEHVVAEYGVVKPKPRPKKKRNNRGGAR